MNRQLEADTAREPANWGKANFQAAGDDKIRGEISDVSIDANSVPTIQQNGRIKIEGTRDGIKIVVITESPVNGGRIPVTGFPTSTPKKP